MAHNEAFTHDYFESCGFRGIDMVTFHKNMEADFTLISDKLKQKLKSKILS